MGFKAPINAVGSQASSTRKRRLDREGQQLSAVILLPHRGNLVNQFASTVEDYRSFKYIVMTLMGYLAIGFLRSCSRLMIHRVRAGAALAGLSGVHPPTSASPSVSSQWK